MSVAVNTLLDRIRRQVRDYPAVDTLSVSADIADATVRVGRPNAGYSIGKVIVVDQEAMLITAQTDDQVTVTRGWLGTSAATHTTGAPILLAPRFSPQDILDAVNEGMRASWPWFFQVVEDESITITSDLQADYAMPAAFGAQGFVTHMDILPPGMGNYGWRPYRRFRHLDGAGARTISLTRTLWAGTQLRLVGIRPWDADVVVGGSFDANMVPDAITALGMYARASLKAIDEAERTENHAAKNIGPMSVAAGASLNLSQALFQSWQQFCALHSQRRPKMTTRRMR